MSGSDSKGERESKFASPKPIEGASLAEFLAAPRPRCSIPASAPNAGAETAPVAEVAPPAGPAATADAADDQAPPAPASGDAEAAARSLIPVATSSSDEPDEPLGGDFQLPGGGASWSSAAVRRATFVALLAAAAAVPAYVVFGARGDMSAQSDSSAARPTAPTPAESPAPPTREIEADEEAPTPAASAAPAVPIDPVKGLELRREARRLLESGQIDQGVATARRAIEANPADPECYVLLAAGLQDQGRWGESREVFSRCVHKSNNGINAECAYFATSGSLTNR
jgi:hypothetical protein